MKFDAGILEARKTSKNYSLHKITISHAIQNCRVLKRVTSKVGK